MRITATDKLIGERLKSFRLSQGLSRQQLATKIGVTHQQIGKYENAIDRIAAARLHVIAKTLNVSIAAFFERENVITSTKQRLSLELQRHFSQMKESRQIALVEVAKTLR